MSYVTMLTKKAGGARRSNGHLLLSGAGTITFDQGINIRVLRDQATDQALAADWKAVGADIRMAMVALSRDLELVDD